MSPLVKITIRVSLVLGFNLSNVGLTFALDEACPTKNFQLNSSTYLNSSVFSPKTNNSSEEEPYDPGDVGNPNNGDGAGSR